MKTYSLSKIQSTLFESMVPRHGKPTVSMIKKFFMESIGKKHVLNEGSNEILNKLIDEVMVFFKNPSENNNRIMSLLKIHRKTKALGGLTNNTPSLTKALEVFSTASASKDRLKDFIRYWLTYILIDYKGFSPLVAFNKELFQLEKALNASRENKTLQGADNAIDYVLSNIGIIPFLKKISTALEETLSNVDLSEKPQESGVISHERFPKNLDPNMKNGDIADKFTFMQDRGMPKSFAESVISSLLEALAKY